MKIFVVNKRKDGRFLVHYLFETGKRIGKIITQEQLEKELEEQKSDPVNPNPRTGWGVETF